MSEFKAILENLNAAYAEFQSKNIQLDSLKAKTEKSALVVKEKEAGLAKKAEDLNKREGDIKHVESIVDFSNKAKKLMSDAKTLMVNADERQTKLEAGFKEVTKAKNKQEKENADFQVYQKNEIAALKKERAELEAKLKTLRDLKVKI